MSVVVYRSDRAFRLWDYTISLTQLLLRSALYEPLEWDHHVDCIFSGTQYIHGTIDYQALIIEKLDREEAVALLPTDRVRRGEVHVFRLTDGKSGEVGWIASHTVRIFTHRSEFDETSLQGIGKRNSTDAVDEVLYRFPL